MILKTETEPVELRIISIVCGNWHCVVRAACDFYFLAGIFYDLVPI